MAVKTQPGNSGEPHHEVPRILGPSGHPAGGYGRIAILVPKKNLNWRDWAHRATKENGYIHNYLQREKARTPQVMRQLASQTQHFQQNNKSDFQKVATIPARTYIRWKAQDPHFWEDESNVKRFLKDNPEARPWKDTPSRYVQGASLEGRAPASPTKQN